MADRVLSVTIRQGEPVPFDLQFSCGAGEVLAIFGPSGSGKTTILRAIAGLATPAHTRVEVGGETWTDTAAGVCQPPHRRPVGYVFQEYALFPHLTARGNVEIALGQVERSQRSRRAEALLQRVHLGPGQAGQAVRTLSGGERQRVALARALAREPRVLLLDEPFSAVDQDVRRRLQDEVDRLRRTLDIPTVLVTHDLADVFRLATHVLVIDHGRVVMHDTLAAVTSRPDAGALRRLIGSGSVLETTVIRSDAARGLTWLDAGGVELVAPLMRAAAGAVARVRIPAREVILSTQRPSGLSLHNILPARVVSVQDGEDGAHAVLQLAVGQATMLSEVTRDAVATLALTPGQAVFALVKSMSIEIVSDTIETI